MEKPNKAERKLTRNEKWILVFVSVLAIISAVLVSSLIRIIFTKPVI